MTPWWWRTQDRLDDLSKQLDGGFGDSEDDATVVLRTSSVYFNGVSKTMVKAVDAMPLLTSEERQTALNLSEKFGEQVLSLTAACRQQSSKAQLTATTAASGTLTEYLSVAAAHYRVPDFKIVPYASSPTEFSAQVRRQTPRPTRTYASSWQLACPTFALTGLDMIAAVFWLLQL